jgi:glycerate-2-kinase
MCGLWAGESTVTVKVPGKGGRNLELALASLPYLREGQLLLAMDSDGFDNTPFAGALVDSDTKVRAKQLGLDPKLYLEQNNSYLFFENVGDFLDTGLTGANVADLVVVLN